MSSNASALWRTSGLIPTLCAVAAAFSGWGLLLPVVPLAVITTGGSNALAGATTGVFMAATVVTQTATPAALRRFGYTPIMVFSAALLGLPAVGYSLTESPTLILLICAIRGVGFGALTVAESAFIAELVPPRYLGRASGALGLVIGFANLISLPVGLALFEHFSAHVVYVLAAGIAVSAAVLCLAIPRRKPAPVSARTHVEAAVRWPNIVVPAAGIGSSAVGFGVISSFLPAALSTTLLDAAPWLTGVTFAVVGGAQMISRYAAGVIADTTRRAGALLPVGLFASAFGLALVVLGLVQPGPPWLIVLAVACFGAGFGVVQNEALLVMFARMPRERVSEASAVWNMSFDAGTGAGSLALGIAAAQAGYPAAFFAGTCIVTCGFLAATAESTLARLRR